MAGDHMIDWQAGRSLAYCNLHMFDNALNTDVTFVIVPTSEHTERIRIQPKRCKRGTEEAMPVVIEPTQDASVKISAHTYVLMSRSPVFWTMFNGLLAEKSGTVEIEDCENAEAFRQMLRFLYSDEVDLYEETVLDVLYLAKKYMLPKLVGHCRRYAKRCLDSGNVCTLYEKALYCAEDDIITACLDIFRTSSNEVFKSPGFLRASRQTLEQILELDVLSVQEEVVWEACRLWAIWHLTYQDHKKIAHATIRKQLGACIHKIQFQNMSLKAFTQSVVQSRVLTKDETCQFYEYMVMADDKENSVSIPKGFSDRRKYRSAALIHTVIPEQSTESILPFDAAKDYVHKYKPVKIGFFLPPNKSVCLRYIMFELQYSKVYGRAVDCFLRDAKKNVLINGVASHARISYADARPVDRWTESVQAYFILHPVEVEGLFDITCKFRSDIAVRVLMQCNTFASFRDKGVDILIEASEHEYIPFSAIGYSFYEKQKLKQSSSS